MDSRNGRRHSKNNHHNWKDSKNNARQSKGRTVLPAVVRQDIQAKEKAIKEFKSREVICSVCGQPISEMSSALADKTTGEPIHFDCALEIIGKNEHLEQNEKITYIGQGRFAVLMFENPRDMRHFKIERIIEWEEHANNIEWRAEISGLYSKVL